MHLICASAPAECIEANGDSAVLFLADGRIQRPAREGEEEGSFAVRPTTQLCAARGAYQ